MFQKWEQAIEAARQECEEENWLEAEKHLATALTEAERFGYNNTRLCETLCKHAEVLSSLNRHDEAFEELSRALTIGKNAFGPIHQEVGLIMTKLGKLSMLYSADDAERHFKQAVSVFRELKDEHVVLPTEQLANLYSSYGRQDEAEVMLRELLDELEMNPPNDQIMLGKALHSLANMCITFDDDEEAAVLFERALPILRDDPEFSAEAANAASNLGKYYFSKEQFDESEDAYDQVLMFASGRPRACAVQKVEALVRLARIHTVVYQNYELAEDFLIRAVDYCKSSEPPLSMAAARSEFARLAQRTGNYERLEEIDKYLLKSYIDLIENEADCGDSLKAITMLAISQAQGIADLLCKQKKWKDAEEYSRWVVKTSANFPGDAPAYRILNEITLATICSEISLQTEAAAICKRLIKDDELEPINSLFLARLVPILTKIGRTQDAEDLVKKLQKRIDDAAEESSKNNNASSYYRLGLAHKYLGKPEHAQKLVTLAVSELEDETGPDSIFLAFVLEDWASELKEAQDEELFKQLSKKASEIRARR